jgi:hypothetical protein
MKKSTADWLNPMLAAAELRGNIDIHAIDRQATRPLRPEGPLFEYFSALMDHHGIPQEPLEAIDWTMFGQLLRAELGWDDYPLGPVEYLLDAS